MPPLSLLIKPASGLCNLRCQYCFYHDVAENRQVPSYGVMETATLEKLLAKALSHAKGRLALAFQGGEPTLAGLEFFRRLTEFVKANNAGRLAVEYSIQTNGVNLNGEWARFFAENGFLVGLSLDGVVGVHDAHRTDAKGGGSFHRVMESARLLKEHGVDVNILSVVTRQLARRTEAVYKFFRKNGFDYLQFIPCLDPFGHTGPRALTDEEYGRFLCTLFDLWFADFERGCAPSVRDFDNYLQMLMGYPPEACNLRGVCGVQTVVEADGSVYPCDFYVLDDLRLGNIHTHSFDEMDARRRELKFIEKSVPLCAECQSCPYLPICRGGCFRHREGEGAKEETAPPKTRFCLSYKMFFEHALPRMQEIARVMAVRR